MSCVSLWETLGESGSVVLGPDDHHCVGRLALEHRSTVLAEGICCLEHISMDVLWSLGLYPRSAKKGSFGRWARFGLILKAKLSAEVGRGVAVSS